jgi:hypothetical protein
MTMFSLVEAPRLFVETVLGLESDGDNGRGLSLTPSVQDELGGCSMPVVPSGFGQEMPGMVVPGLGNWSPLLFVAGRALGGDKAEVGHKTSWGREAADIVDFEQERQRSEGFNATQTTESFDLRSVWQSTSGAFEFGVESQALGFEILEFDGQSSLGRALEGVAELGEPQSVFLGPGGLAVSKDKAMISEYAGDAVFGGLAVDLISRSQSQGPSQGFLVFIGDMNGCKMSASVKTGEHGSIELIGLTSITRFARDQRWSDHVAMEAVVGKDTLEDEACTGSFVARSDGSVLGETPKAGAPSSDRRRD